MYSLHADLIVALEWSMEESMEECQSLSSQKIVDGADSSEGIGSKQPVSLIKATLQFHSRPVQIDGRRRGTSLHKGGFDRALAKLIEWLNSFWNMLMSGE